MSSTLKRYKLRQLIEVTRGQSLSGEYYAEQGDIIRLTLANFDYQNGGFKEDLQKTDIYYTGSVKTHCLLNKGDIITPLTEQTPGLLGSTARIPESGKYVQSGDVALIKCNEELIDPSFCYYLLPSSQVKKQLAAGSQQTKIRHTSPDAIKDCIVDIPGIEQQRKIGKLLDAITEKIDENRKQNAILEKMVKQVYDYWFVQFDFPDENERPYKSSGGKMVWNGTLKREIPVGWNVKDIDSLCSFNNRSLTTRTMPNRMLYLDTSNLTQNYITELQELTSNFPSRARRLVQNKTILYSTVRPNLCHYGILINPDNELVVSTGFATIDVNDEDVLSPYMLYSYLTSPSNVQYLHNIAVNAVSSYPSINPSDIGQMKLAIPHDTSIMKDYNSRVADIYSKINTNCNEIKHLSELRSYLLPLLMTGQVKLK